MADGHRSHPQARFRWSKRCGESRGFGRFRRCRPLLAVASVRDRPSDITTAETVRRSTTTRRCLNVRLCRTVRQEFRPPDGMLLHGEIRAPLGRPGLAGRDRSHEQILSNAVLTCWSTKHLRALLVDKPKTPDSIGMASLWRIWGRGSMNSDEVRKFEVVDLFVEVSDGSGGQNDIGRGPPPAPRTMAGRSSRAVRR